MDRSRGSVTAETAVCLPALVVVAAVLVWAVSVAALQLRCVDAARTVARAVARGESVPSARAAALTAVPGADVVVRLAGDEVSVRVVAEAAAPRRLPVLALTVRAEAVAAMEPTSSTPPTIATQVEP